MHYPLLRLCPIGSAGATHPACGETPLGTCFDLAVEARNQARACSSPVLRDIDVAHVIAERTQEIAALRQYS